MRTFHTYGNRLFIQVREWQAFGIIQVMHNKFSYCYVIRFHNCSFPSDIRSAVIKNFYAIIFRVMQEGKHIYFKHILFLPQVTEC